MLTRRSKILLGGVVVLGAVGLLASLARLLASIGSATSHDDEHAETPRLSMPPGKAHEQEVADLLEQANPDAVVLRNPSYRRADGSLRRPDIVLLHADRTIEVQECKDVAKLELRHVRQTREYASDIGHRSGIVISERTFVPHHVATLAMDSGISITRKV